MTDKLLCWLGFHDFHTELLPVGRLVEVEYYWWLKSKLLSVPGILPGKWYCHRCRKHFYERCT